MQQHEPLHADRHKTSFNITLVLAVGLAAVGLFNFDPLWLTIGVAMGAYTWFTTPSQYVIFADRLLIAYGRPRLRHVVFQQITEVEMLKLAIGDRLRIRLARGGSIYLQPRDPGEFEGHLQRALESYRPGHATEGEVDQQG